MKNQTVKSSLRDIAPIILFITGFILLNVESPLVVVAGLLLWVIAAFIQ